MNDKPRKVSLLGDDDVPPFIPARHIPRDHYVRDENFEDLQLLGHKENSEDFSDSPFADRV